MKIFLAGATGALGRSLVPQLVAAGPRGHRHDALARRRPTPLRAQGAEPVVVDALDRDAVIAAVVAARPDAVVHQLTAIGKFNPRSIDRTFALTNRLRTEGTDHLLAAARAAGVERFVAQSFAGWPYAREGGPVKARGRAAGPRSAEGGPRDARRDPPPRARRARRRRDRAALRRLLRPRDQASPRAASSTTPCAGASSRSSATAPACGRSCTSMTRRRRRWRRSSAASRASTTSSTTSRRRCATSLPALAAAAGAGAAAPDPALRRPPRARPGRHRDDDRDPRRVERQGPPRAALGAGPPDLARGVPRALTRGDPARGAAAGPRRADRGAREIACRGRGAAASNEGVRHGCRLPDPLGPPRALGAHRRLRVRPLPLHRPCRQLGLRLPPGERQARRGRRAEGPQPRLKARRRELRDAAALEREARRLGMVKAGEKAFVVELPPLDR